MSIPDQPGEARGNALGKTLMPPYRILRDFLDEQAVTAFLDYSTANEAAFTKSRVRRGLDPEYRSSLWLRLGDLKKPLKEKVLAVLPQMLTELGVRQFQPSNVELELIAHGDGAFYKPHVDTSMDNEADRTQRVISGVYYFHAQPQAYTGGELRLFGVGVEDARDGQFVDIVPENNMLLMFPSWARHEVRRVSCPSRRFADSRFAINCWIRCAKTAAFAPRPNTAKDTRS
jgi:Rps23 Pro-64 3,4-dihydroxylase Tpa1-like proline 4-hydroxylase